MRGLFLLRISCLYLFPTSYFTSISSSPATSPSFLSIPQCPLRAAARIATLARLLSFSPPPPFPPLPSLGRSKVVKIS